MRRTAIGRERRGAPRYAMALMVNSKAAIGVTRNVSATGVLFESAAGELPREGQELGFQLSLQTLGAQVGCRGRVVRVEQSGRRFLVATTIDDWHLECQPPARRIVKITAVVDV